MNKLAFIGALGAAIIVAALGITFLGDTPSGEGETDRTARSGSDVPIRSPAPPVRKQPTTLDEPRPGAPTPDEAAKVARQHAGADARTTAAAPENSTQTAAAAPDKPARTAAAVPGKSAETAAAAPEKFAGTTDAVPGKPTRRASAAAEKLARTVARVVEPFKQRPSGRTSIWKPAKPASKAGSATARASLTQPPDSAGLPEGKIHRAAKAAAAPIVPRFDVVRVNPAGDIVVAGRAAPNAVVVVSDGETELGRTQADKRGDWVLLPSTPLAPGSHELSLAGHDGSLKNAPAILSKRTVILVVPESGKDIAGRPSAAPTGALALAVPRTGKGGSVVLQKPATRPATGASSTERETRSDALPPAVAPPDISPAAGPALRRDRPPQVAIRQPDPKDEGGKAQSALTLETIDYDQKGRVEIGGRAPEGARVQLYLDNQPLGEARATDSGEWRVVPSKTVEPGPHRLRVDQIDRKGTVVARIESPFSRAGPLGDLPRGTVVFVQPGNSLWRIARRTYGRGVRFTVIYDANRKQIRDPDLIYPGQIFVLPKPARSAG